ncbi:MAG: hypothetical protein MJ107_00475 [Lachnospiraceae bacterium]|nr:hypothetical protein [Lachnospiraceae bacterium]
MKKKQIISLIIFLAIAYFVFARVTYLYRDLTQNRTNIVDFKDERNLDVAVIGASTVLYGWQPLTAWDKLGITSYGYSQEGIELSIYKYYIKNIMSTNKPDLYIIDLRKLTYMLDELGTVRKYAHYEDVLYPRRLEVISNYFSDREFDRSLFTELVFDIGYYHEQDVLGNPEHWEFIDNRKTSVDINRFKGNSYKREVGYFEKPQSYTTEVGELNDAQLNALTDLLDFCKLNKLNVLFIVCPYPIGHNDYITFNAAKEVVNSYGYPFVNTNDYIDEMGLDFNFDFTDRAHLAVSGAEKYTGFLCDYLEEHYDLQDHRGEKGYEKWEEEANEFRQYAVAIREDYDSNVGHIKQSIEKGDVIRKSEQLSEWLENTNDESYTVFIAVDSENVDWNSNQAILFKALGMEQFWRYSILQMSNSEEITRVLHWEPISLDADMGDDLFVIRQHVEVSTDAVNKIVYRGEEYTTDKFAILMAVNKYTNEMVDCIEVEYGDEMLISHINK